MDKPQPPEEGEENATQKSEEKKKKSSLLQEKKEKVSQSGLPKAEKAFLPGFGCMVTREWKAAQEKFASLQMIGIARKLMQQ
jgi:hypothetical protein